ncbi:predicted protein [Streptomyces filamentosus NRRL 15998]|uniref:Predicted protein n=1 Tax=Streptomyces filamentosus NRRL 15998 TaxID=457431 RepID=D6AG59_STRFL|nr:predicted protein [Streptomyces filamentosus NRRL 15998]
MGPLSRRVATGFGTPSETGRSFFQKSRNRWRGGRSLLVRDGHGTGP